MWCKERFVVLRRRAKVSPREDFTFEQLEAKCMFLYAERDTVFGQGTERK